MTDEMQDIPQLHPDELAEIRRVIGRDLTNDEAQALLHQRMENPVDRLDLAPILEQIKNLGKQ